MTIDHKQVIRLLNRARTDLSSASYLSRFDQPAAMGMTYMSMMHAGVALMWKSGFRSGRTQRYQSLISGVRKILGEIGRQLVLTFNRLRQKENQFEYEAFYEMEPEGLKEAIREAHKFVDLVSKHL